MTLPQETIDKIKAQAKSKSYAKVKGSFESEYGRGYRSGYETGHEDGATEWAGKAQWLVDALDKIASFEVPKNHAERKSYIAYTKSVAFNALAKYKEVSNG